MVVGSISKIGSTYAIDARLIDVETSESYYSGSYSNTGKIDRLLLEGMKSIAHQLSDLPFINDNIQNVQETTNKNDNNKSLSKFTYYEYFKDGKIKVEGEDYTNKIKNGLWVRYYNPSEGLNLLNKKEYFKIEETYYVDDKKHGTERFYFESGKVNRIKNYKNDILHGSNITLSESGQIIFYTHYVDGEICGFRTIT
jgi:antitoxin component YwqK of YwqJK toxin-antitoxin module